MDNSEVEKLKSFKLVDLLDYKPRAVVARTLCRNPAGRILVASFDNARAQPENTSPYDTLIQVIDGSAELVINAESYLLGCGECIVIPAHARSMIKANQRFKLLTTIINSSFDEKEPFDIQLDIQNKL